jgi:site-specific recombinase XerD
MDTDQTPHHIKPQIPYFDDFLLYIKTQNYSEETLYNYERDLTYLINFLEDEKLHYKDLNKQLFNRFKAWLFSRDRKLPFTGLTAVHSLEPGSVNRCLSSIRTYLRYLIDIDQKVPLPPDAVKMVKAPKKYKQVAELSELVKLVESPENFEKDPLVGLRNRAMLEVLLSTGMRISELISLNKNQLDGTGRMYIRGKGKKERFVYLTDRAAKWINLYLSKRDDTAQALFIPYRGLNGGKITRRISPNYLQYKIKEYREKLRINVPTSAHSLRHGFATYLAESGANPAAIQILLGHESLDTTTRYVHASDKFAEETHRKFHPVK